MGTFDHLIISMGIHLAHIHGRENVAILSADDRLTDILTHIVRWLALFGAALQRLDVVADPTRPGEATRRLRGAA
jgi:hypothetical protein